MKLILASLMASLCVSSIALAGDVSEIIQSAQTDDRGTTTVSIQGDAAISCTTRLAMARTEIVKTKLIIHAQECDKTKRAYISFR